MARFLVQPMGFSQNQILGIEYSPTSIYATTLLIRLPDRVPHALSAHQVHMQVVDHLAPVRARIDDQAVAVLVDAFFFGQFPGDCEEMSHELLIFWEKFVDRCDVFVRHDQDVRWSDRMNIQESG